MPQYTPRWSLHFNRTPPPVPVTDPTTPTQGDFAPEQFAHHGHELVDWITRYLGELREYPVLPRVSPGDIAAQLPTAAPAQGESLDDILRDVREVLLPGITHWQHPGFFGYFSITASVPGMLAELISTALNVNGMLWATSPAASELEQVTVRWLAQLLGVNADWFGQLTDTASTSTLLALAAARERTAAWDVRRQGLAGRPELPRLRVYCSELAHSSVDKAVMVLGIGLDNLVRLPVDEDFRLRPDALEAQIRADRVAGYHPLVVVATAGTTGVASVDPVPAIAAIAQREGLWLHVDAAYAGAAAVAPELRGVLAGVEHADSLVVNPHKWLFTPVGCSALWVRDADALRRAFTVVPEYLRTESGATLDYHDVGYQLGRPFRALKLWMVLRAFGAEGLAARIREHNALATHFAGQVHATPNWTVAAPVHFSLVCVRYAPPGMAPTEADALNRRILARVNAGGRVLLSHTTLHERVVLRLAIGNLRTTVDDVDAAWRALQEAAALEQA
jgi:aromatic-L-amino-acid decarboxylase